MKNVVFMGSDEIGIPVLKLLAEDITEELRLLAVVSQPDKPSGRGKKLQPNPLARWAEESEIHVLKPEKPGQELIDFLKEHDVQLVVVMAYGHILSDELLAVPKFGFINLHTSILPSYRGASPIQSAMASMEKETGVTLMEVIRKMDAGPIIDVAKVKISPEDTGATMYSRLAEAAADVLDANLGKVLSSDSGAREQDEAAATYTRKLIKSDGQLNFSASAEELAARIQAFDPWPGCYFEHNGNRIKVRGAKALDVEHTNAPGEVLKAGKDNVQIATAKGVLSVTELQRPGGRMLPADEFLRGYEMQVGTMLVSSTMADLVYDKPYRYPKS